MSRAPGLHVQPSRLLDREGGGELRTTSSVKGAPASRTPHPYHRLAVFDVHWLLFLRTQLPSSNPTIGTADIARSGSGHARSAAPPWGIIINIRGACPCTYDPP